MKNLVRELRRERGYSQERLGELIGVSRQTIHAVETGKFEPSIWLAHDLAAVFGLAIEEVFLFGESACKSRSLASRADGRGKEAAYGA